MDSGGLQSTGLQSQTQLTRLHTYIHTHTHTHTHGLPWWSSGSESVTNPDAGDLGSIPGQGTRPHVPQLRICLLHLRPSAVK